MVEPI